VRRQWLLVGVQVVIRRWIVLFGLEVVAVERHVLPPRRGVAVLTVA
jgi:hypothetical protein